MPKILVRDEPTSALDVSVQAQTLNELLRLQKELNMTYIFIPHTLSVVRYMSDRICVMYGGKVMELGKTDDIYFHCLHPYTMGLLSSVPPLHPKERNRKKMLLSGDMPSLIDVGEGCRFCSRCKFATELCETTEPSFKEMGEGHYVASVSYTHLLYMRTDDYSLIDKVTCEIEDLIVDKLNDFKNMLVDVGVSENNMSRLLRIYDLIYENAANKLNLKEIAEREYVSVQYLSKEFNEKLHINFKTTVEYYKAVSYTHLDVYKRQSKTRCLKQASSKWV